VEELTHNINQFFTSQNAIYVITEQKAWKKGITEVFTVPPFQGRKQLLFTTMK